MNGLHDLMKKEKKNKGLLMQLQHFSVHDGDGIRSTIFMAGCPLRCHWCANPESWGKDEFSDPASGKSLRYWSSLEEVVKEVDRYRIFFRYSGGGVTYSGGEPTCQPDFLELMVNRFYAMGINQTIETCGYFNWHRMESILQKIDVFLIDIKTMDQHVHEAQTGSSNELILDNIKRIGQWSKRVIIRIPLIPGVNDVRSNIEKTAAFVLQHVPGGCIEVLPYHNLGLEKYALLGINTRQKQYRVPTLAELNNVRDVIEKIGVKTVSLQ